MNPLFSIELLIGILAGLVTAMIVLLALQVRNSMAVNRLAAPVYDFVLHEADQQAKQIIEKAKREAKQIRDEAEEERDVLIANYTEEIHTLQQTFTTQLATHTNKMEQTLATTFQKTVDAWQTAGIDMQARMMSVEQTVTGRFSALETALEEAQATIGSQATVAVGTFEKGLEETVIALREKLEASDAIVTAKVDEHTKGSLKAIDDALLSYRSARERILDTHMAQIIEAVATDVLHKQLTLNDHAELAKQALIDAKQRHLL